VAQGLEEESKRAALVLRFGGPCCYVLVRVRFCSGAFSAICTLVSGPI
jgi:hypothetical protein